MKQKLAIANLKILNDNILVEGIKPELRDGIKRGVSQDDKPQEGIILQVGPGKQMEYGLLPTQLKVGMLILFNEHTTSKFNIDGKNYYVLREEDVVGYQ